MRICVFLLFFCLYVNGQLHGQELVKSEDFSVKTPFLEPEERTLLISLESGGFISLGKNKGNTRGPSNYILESRRDNLSVKWKSDIHIGANENVLHLSITDGKVVLFSVTHDEKARSSRLQASFFDWEDGHYIEEKLLLEHEVERPQHSIGKGAPALDFNTLAASGSKRGYVTPLEYRYNLNYSPDGNLLLFYRYDFSKANLIIEAAVFDSRLALVNKASLPVDRGYVNYGLHVNNQGNVFLLNAKPEGTIAVIYYSLDEKSSSFQELSPSNTERSSFKLSVLSDCRAKVDYINERNNSLVGISYAIFDFCENNLEKVQFHGLKNVFDSIKASGEEVKKDHFQIAGISAHEKGYLYLLERRQYLSAGKNFTMNEGDHLDNWRSRKGRLLMGEILIVNIDHEDSVRWGQIISKNQSNISDEGSITSGFAAEIFPNRVNLLFAEGTGNASLINHVSLGLLNGEKKRAELPNPHQLVFLRPYTLWLNANEVILAGKKGFAAKSSMLLKYKIDN